LARINQSFLFSMFLGSTSIIKVVTNIFIIFNLNKYFPTRTLHMTMVCRDLSILCDEDLLDG